MQKESYSAAFYKAEFDFRCTTVSCHAVLGMFQPGYIVASAFSGMTGMPSVCGESPRRA